MNKYTPGPWKLEDGEPHPSTSIFGADNKLVVAGEYDGYMTPFSCRNYKEALANAQLISAAPELLSALEDIVDWISIHDKAADKYNNAKAAISKAKGESL